MPEIRLEQVSKYYRQEQRRIAAVQQVDLTISQGEFVFVIGSSGAGKTTLLQLIAGIIPPSGGRIWFSTESKNPIRRWRGRRADEIG